MKQRRDGMLILWLIGGLTMISAHGATDLQETETVASASPPPVVKEVVPARPQPESSDTATLQLIPLRPALEHYRIITDRNMFQRRTAIARTNQNNVPATPRPINPAAYWLLSGTVTFGTQQVAFFENSQNRQTVRVTLHESIPAGQVVKIDHDRVEMIVEGRRRVVEIGQRIDPLAVGVHGSTAGEEPTGLPTGEMSLLERMRARRQQELNR